MEALHLRQLEYYQHTFPPLANIIEDVLNHESVRH
jgi:hypothetical protein